MDIERYRPGHSARFGPFLGLFRQLSNPFGSHMPPLKRPSQYAPVPLGFADAPKPTVLLDELGPAGPYCLVVLILLAQSQSYDGGDWGWARKVGWLALAQKVGVDREMAQRIARRIAELGEIELVETAHGFDARLVGFEAWSGVQPKDRTAAGRQARRRAKERDAA